MSAPARSLILIATFFGIIACSPKTASPAGEIEARPEAAPRVRAAAGPAEMVRTENPAWPLGVELLDQSAAQATALTAAISALLNAPTIENLEEAQRLWRDTAASIERFHLFSRLGTVAPQDYQKLVDLQFNLSAWPIQPGYLDGFGDHPYSGIVFDIGVPMTKETLRDQHGMTDNSDATLGVYAMEFLLFGEKNNRGPLVFQPITGLNEKYREDGYTSVEELPRNRRRELLRLQSALLVEDIGRVKEAWTGNQPGQLQHAFEVLSAEQQTTLLQKAALALATEQLVTIANQSAGDLWQGQQLADRLTAQLDGLARLHQAINLGEQVPAQIGHYAASLNTIRRLPPLDERGMAPRVDWQDAYTNLRELIKTLNPTQPLAQ